MKQAEGVVYVSGFCMLLMHKEEYMWNLDQNTFSERFMGFFKTEGIVLL